jgi:hypothetical protein
MSTPINKAVTAYGIGWSDADTTYAALHFNLVNADFGNAAGMQAIKTKNPNVKIIGYKIQQEYPTADDWVTVNANESWFVHAADGVTRIKSKAFGWYLMDVGNAGFRQHWVSVLNSKLSASPAYDGVMMDNPINDLTVSYVQNDLDQTVPASVVSRWHSDTIGFLRYVKANILSGKIVIINDDEFNGTSYLNEVDGDVIEGFIHAMFGAGINDYARPSVDSLVMKLATGKIVWASSSVNPSTATAAQVATLLKFCYAGFLLCMNAKAYWSWTANSMNWYSDLYGGYQSIMDTDIGQPTGAYYSSQSVYMRDFTNGRVLFNPSANSYTISLGKTYYLLDGTPVTSVVLQPHSGGILLTGTAPPPPQQKVDFNFTVPYQSGQVVNIRLT